MKNYSEAIKNNLHIDQHRTLKEAVYHALRTTIILGDIPAGQRINELELSNALNISRTPIRHALTKLIEEKLVEHKPEIGTLVKGISIKDAYEIFKIRVALEVLATTEAMNKMTDEEFDQLKGILLLGNQYNEEDRVDELLETFSNFNEYIFKMADMPRLHSMIIEIKSYLDYFRDISIRASERRTLALEEHWMIYRGMERKDKTFIEMLITEHLDHSLQFILQEMERHNIE